MRINRDEMKKVFSEKLVKYGFSKDDADVSAEIFVKNSLDGVYSHGVNRFPRVISYIQKGYIKPQATATMDASFGCIERWNGNLAMGNITAQRAMDRAIEIAHESGVGVVAIQNTNHWMRGGTYGWQAANNGCVGICWTNTQPNMPAWGAKDRRIGNNPFVMSVPRADGNHIVVDLAMAQYSYGKIEEAQLKGKQLPFPGGFDKDGNLSTDPKSISETWRVLPIGYWKGSGLSIVLDLVATILSGGKSVCEIGKLGGDEFSLSQVVMAIDPEKLSDKETIEKQINEVLDDLHGSVPVTEGGSVLYPGERTMKTRLDNEKNGIPVDDGVWEKILNA